MVVLNSPIALDEVDSKFVMGMNWQQRDKNRCYCSC